MICVRDLHVSLGGRRILEGVELDVADGEAVALVGPNGAGKTTLLRCLMGLVRYHGYVSIGGVDLARDPIGAKRRLGYMPQLPAFGEERVRAALCFVAALREVPRAEVDRRLAQVGLAAHASRPVRQLSTGMRQRLSLAAALLGAPPVLALDEPTASLDLRSQGELIALLQGLQDGGQTLLLSSHRAEEIRALALRVVVLDEGRVVANGPVDEIAAAVWGAKPRLVARPRWSDLEVAV
jgi:ABC-type multidrug transport system ATPase subunit